MMRGKRLEGKPGEPAGSSGHAQAPQRGARSVTKGSARTAGRFVAAAEQVRIIGGRWKRTPLPVPDVPGLRPSPDRVRETVFNWLAHLLPDLPGASGLDLFAGTGALGFELASRGAARVTLVEVDPAVVAQLHRTKEKLNAAEVSIVRGDGLAFAAAAPAHSCDVVFVDPPFDAGLMPAALRAAARLLTTEGLVYAESGTPIDAELAAGCGLDIVRAGRAGRVHFHLLQRA